MKLNFFYYGISYLILFAFFILLGYAFYDVYQRVNNFLFIFLVFYLVNAFFAILLFVQKRNINAKVSWLMIIFLLPVLGYILFMFFGRRYRDRKSLDEYRQHWTYDLEVRKFQHDDFLNFYSNISRRGVYFGNTQLFRGGHDGYQSLFADLRKAKKYIHLCYYIIKPGEIYEEFKSILMQKAREGVIVRLIVDDFGRWGLPWYEVKELNETGVEVAIFGHMLFPFIGSNNGYRMHRKMAIIDGQVVHTGGLNIANEYASISKDYGLWLDYQVRMEGDCVRSFECLFLRDWEKITKKKITEDVSENFLPLNSQGDSKLVLVESSPEIKNSLLHETLVSLILKAKKSIKIVTPYFVPTPEIELAIRTAANSGVKISLFIPGKPDKKTVWVVTRTYAKWLMSYGVSIYELKDMLVHSKFGIFDDEYAFFGTSNLDMRSVYSQLEFVVVTKGKLASELDSLANDYQTMSKSLGYKDLRISKFKELMLRFYVFLFSPIM